MIAAMDIFRSYIDFLPTLEPSPELLPDLDTTGDPPTEGEAGRIARAVSNVGANRRLQGTDPPNEPGLDVDAGVGRTD